MKNQLVFLAILFSVSGCLMGSDKVPNVREEGIGSKVYACAAGFGDEVASKLQVEYEENVKKGDAGVQASRKTAAAILTLLPESQRLEGYKEYVKCLQIDIDVPEKINQLSIPEAMKLAVDTCSGKDIDPSQYDSSETRSAEDIKQLLGEDFDQESLDKYNDCVSKTFDRLLPDN